MTTEKMPAKIAGALVKATREAEAVEKKRTVDSKSERGPKYNFAGADALMEEARVALFNAGLAVILTGWNVETIDRHDWAVDGSGEKGDMPPFTEREFRWSERAVVVAFTLAHEEGDTWDLRPYSMPSIPGPGRPTDKADASAITYSTGYVMRGLLNLPRVEPGQQVDERDDSGHAPRGQVTKKAPSAEEKSAALVAEVRGAIAEIVDIEGWCRVTAAKAVKVVGMEVVTEALVKRAGDLKIDPAGVHAWLAKAVAASKKGGGA